MSRRELSQRFEFRDCLLSKYCSLTPTVKLVLLALDSFRSPQSPMPFPSVATLCEITGYSDKAVRNALISAAALGWIDKHQRRTKQGNRTSDLYVLHVPQAVLESVTSGTTYREVPVPRTEESLYLNPITECSPPNGNGQHRETWITPFVDAYRAVLGEPDVGPLLAAAQPAYAALGPVESLKAFKLWLRTPETRYGGVKNFRGNWQLYVPVPILLDNGDVNPAAQAQAARMGIQL